MEPTAPGPDPEEDDDIVPGPLDEEDAEAFKDDTALAGEEQDADDADPLAPLKPPFDTVQ
jgi:hypothetical protein